MINNLYKKLIPAAAAILIVILSSCGGTELPAPTGLAASDPDADNPNRIELSWLPVDGADIYYVYRDGSSSGSFEENVGHSVTSSNVETESGEELRYLFLDNFDAGEGGTYWYKVTAAPNADISLESAKSGAVEAQTYEGTWSEEKLLGDAAALKLAAGITTLYAVYADNAATDTIYVQTYAEDEDSDADEPPMIWTAITSSPGNTNAGVVNPFSVFISGGELYTAFIDADSTPTADAVTMKYYHDSSDDADNPSFAWTAIGTAGFNGAAASELSTATVGFAGTIYSAFLSQTEDISTIEDDEDADADEASLYKYNSTTDTWFLTMDNTGDLPFDAENIQLLNHNNTLYVGYEDTDGTNELYIRAYDDGVTALQAGGLIEASDIETGNLAFVSGGSDLYAAYIAGGNFEVEQLVDDVWTPLSNTTGKPTVPTGGGIGTFAAHWFNGYLYVFYVNSGDSNKGWVKYYDEDDGWQTAAKNSTAITGNSGLGSFQLTSSGNRLYAGYIENGKAYVKILE